VQNLALQPVYARLIPNADQTPTANTPIKVSFQTATFDIGTFFDNVTNFRYTPLYPGKYLVSTAIQFSYTTAGDNLTIAIYKNGSAYSNVFFQTALAQPEITGFTDAVIMNGSTDYLEIFVTNNVNISSGTIKKATAQFGTNLTFNRLGNI
jgi:hypothetical protein